MITAYCFTNLDSHQRVIWPTKFVAVPRVGDRVEGRFPDRESLRPSLKVVGITHRLDNDNQPAIAVELHL